MQQLVYTVNTENDELWSLCFKKWIVATVGCATVDSITNQTAIIFVGNQGVGKTRWMKRLVPLRLENYFYSGIPNLKDKDSKIRLSECFLINMDEMDNLAKHHSERLKEMISKASIRERRPYGRNDELMPRRASFMGSVNSRQFLNDSTGTRRYLGSAE
ncbi:VapE family protein [Chitinophaga sancti]|uniref:VapE domain-containing protein n=1 Tax=Chitinophaga sancti TaxID=1004 RepID=UPI002A76512D|nr:VapE domain-containing protein [Chitinophaga sancti]WPQ66598.1 VapE family protein [Chitinophaga sancti]